jgi:hypothetical protein
MTNPLTILARKSRHNGHYLCTPLGEHIDGEHHITIPLSMDTEYWQTPWQDLLRNDGEIGRRGVTVQVRGALEGPSVIFVHPDYAEYARDHSYTLRHPVMRTGFAAIDYLQYLGHNAHLERNEDAIYVDSLPRAQIVTYAHFALAELFMIVHGSEFTQDVIDLLLIRSITMQRRLTTKDKHTHFIEDYCRMPWILHIDQFAYGVEWCIIDTGAVHGNASYKNFCANSGITLDAKDLMHDLGLIETMHEAYQSHPVEYDNYSLGDLEIYPALAANAVNFGRIWQSLDVGAYYRQEPYLTIGKSICDMFEAKVLQLFDVDPSDASSKKEVLERYCHPASAEYLRKRVDTTATLLAKVEGGRCRNNRPTVATLDGVLVDLDLKGCYGEGQRNQLYPFGRPFIIDYPADSEYNDYQTLRKFLQVMRWGKKNCELVPGLWHARVSLAEDTELKYAQDYLGSWFNFSIRDIAEKPFDPRIADLDDPLYELDVHTGTLKVLTHDLQNAVITHDFIQWVDHVASVPQRQELLDNLYVHAAMLYPASQRVDDLETLAERHAKHNGKNKCIMTLEKGLLTKISKHQECHAWFAVNLGDFLINELLANRSLYPKKTPLNEMFKLATNTLYGDLVSPFFKSSNSTVGNNITARARAACWYMEKGLYAVQSITDGGVFDLNTVVYPADNKQRITAQSVTLMHQVRDLYTQRRIRLAPLGGYDQITLTYDQKTPILSCHTGDAVEVKRGDDALTWINTEAMAHLQRLFPNVDVLHASTTRLKAKVNNGELVKSFEPRTGQFEFEAKKIYVQGTFHGSANYFLRGFSFYKAVEPSPEDDEPRVSMRAYEKRKHYTTYLHDQTLVAGTTYDLQTPARAFLESLLTPHAVPRSAVFVKESILKPNDFVAHYDSVYKHTPLKPGDSIFKAGLLREFSLAQFTFRSVAQFKAIERQWHRCKARYGEYVETYFLHEDGTLDFERMIRAIDDLISNGTDDLLKGLDNHRHILRKRSRNHTALASLEATREFIKRVYQFPADTTDNLVGDTSDTRDSYSSDHFTYKAD